MDRTTEFEEFAAASWSRLQHAGWLLTGHQQDAEDLASIALAKTFASWGKVRKGQPYAYARRCLVNAQIDRVRRHRGREVVTDHPPEQAHEATLDGAVDREHLAQLLAILSDRERQMVVLRFYLDASEADVARDLDVSVGTVKSTVSRALAKLRVAHPETISTGVTP